MSPAELLPKHGEAPDVIKASRLAEILGVTTPTLMRWVELGKLPKPTRLGPRTVLFRMAEVRKALEKLNGDAPPVSPPAPPTIAEVAVAKAKRVRGGR